MFSASDDTVMMKQIQATHNPDGRVVMVRPIISIVQGIFQHVAAIIDGVLNVSISYSNVHSLCHLHGLERLLCVHAP